jgi:O-antigen/teichoic acid export membrane protein
MSMRRSLLSAVSSRFAGVFLQLLSSLVIARLLAPAEFGLFGIASSVIAISGSLREFGVTSYLIRLDAIDRLALGRALAFTMSLSLGAGLAIFLARHPIATFFHHPEIADLIAVLCLNFALIPPTIGATAVIQRQLRFGILSLIQLGGIAATIAATIAMAAAGLGPMSLAIGQVLQMAIFLVCMTVLDWRSVIVMPVFTGMGDMIRFGSFSALSGVTNQLGAYVTSLVLGRTLGPAAVGIYDRGNGMFMQMGNEVVANIGYVMFVGLSRVRDDSAALTRMLLEALRNMTAIIWPGFALVAVLAHPLMGVMFGPSWVEAVPVLQILCLSGLLISGTNLYTQTVLAMGGTQRMFAIELAGQGSRVVGVLALASFGVTAAAWASVIAMGIIFLLYLAAARRYIHTSRRDIIAIYAQSLGLALLTATPAALLTLLAPPNLPQIILLATGGTLGLATWLTIILTLRHPLAGELHTVLGQIKDKLK